MNIQLTNEQIAEVEVIIKKYPCFNKMPIDEMKNVTLTQDEARTFNFLFETGDTFELAFTTSLRKRFDGIDYEAQSEAYRIAYTN